ncbi:cation diffusion facilitator family transporter [Dethiobacter alkaliphilus]|uniref:cation diffusion facilitator family transporter n=1 Tax=Dethiobacter alkaliphilus TaxID=427926 RepID=UPI0018C890B6|nr:cation diffusion facilitator family transporter [Dethiobacter alkaliphilus]
MIWSKAYYACAFPVKLNYGSTGFCFNLVNSAAGGGNVHKEIYRGRKARKVALVGFLLNSVLAAFKILAGIIGSSGAVLADGVHSISDFFTDIVVIVGFKITERPEDDCHNYGHGKYESLAAVAISLFLVVVGFQLLRNGLANIVSAAQGEVLPRPGGIALAAAVISIIIKEFLFRYTLNVGKKIKSSVVIANAWHHRSDTYSSFGVLLGVGGAFFLGQRWIILDPIASVMVSLLIFKVAIDTIRPALEELVETSLNEDEIDRIEKTISNHPGVIDFHQLRTRRIGTKAAIEFHLVLDAEKELTSAHEVATAIENKLKSYFTEDSIITIHLEPDISKTR